MALSWWHWLLVWCVGSVPFGFFVGHLIAAGRGKSEAMDLPRQEEVFHRADSPDSRSAHFQEG